MLNVHHLTFVKVQRSLSWLQSLSSAQKYANLKTSVLGVVDCASTSVAIGLPNGLDRCSYFLYFL
jgi:hypothetical protein